ncbi:hypothetical protein FHT44_004971 [Mycolicibacterium sp. BK634]|uniref:hypothetical protein n=1 Tax=Mycolicibacterium sp. BK634 TaxID=2587099 RepID=UPI0016166649|nr:hypothetical protein [Mycolicibacterium sp. BK634]MBB3752459.1 hypothetical protein [Mycolicibacterium sp. BK634]
MTTLPDPKLCKCGYLVEWFEPCDPAKELPSWYRLDFELKTDVVERECPHRNGTVIEHCPWCDRQVGIWGFGPAGGMECKCWNDPWWKILYWRFLGLFEGWRK